MASPLINAQGLSHKIQTRKILDNVSLTLNEGDFITIIGPNGAGKTTLLKALIGLFAPQEGMIKRKSGLKIGYIPQKMTIEPSLPISTERFITLNKPDTAALPALIDELNLTPLLKMRAHHLSGGEWQRVLLARALLDNPDAIILDEPAQNLDLKGQARFYQYLDEIHQSRKLAILMVSHDLHMVMASTRQVVCLYHHVCCSGVPQAVAKHPEFTNLFGKDMAKMMAIYQHDHTHDHDHHHHGEHDD